MKKILAIILLASSLNFAQDAEITTLTQSDSIDLQAIVAKQMAAAIEKQLNQKIDASQEQVISVKEEKPVVVEKKTAIKTSEKKQLQPIQADASPFFSILAALPWQYKVFALISTIIVAFVFARRAILSFTRSSKKVLKKKIGLMREEKVGGSKENPRLEKARKSLKDNLELLKQADGQISKRAKQLNISKGELLLAARLKLFEVGKS